MIQTMLSLGLGIPALLIVLLAAWANGASNLYSGSLVLAAVFQRSRRSTVTIGGAILGLGAALSGVTDQVVPYLLLLSIAIPPIAGVYLSRFFIDLRGGGARADPGEWDLIRIARQAEAIILGCTGFFGCAAVVRKHLLDGGYDIPVIDPLPLATLIAGSVVRQGISHSRIGFPAYDLDKPMTGYAVP
jgi:purine-cytosine permease-like protein